MQRGGGSPYFHSYGKMPLPLLLRRPFARRCPSPDRESLQIEEGKERAGSRCLGRSRGRGRLLLGHTHTTEAWLHGRGGERQASKAILSSLRLILLDIYGGKIQYALPLSSGRSRKEEKREGAATRVYFPFNFPLSSLPKKANKDIFPLFIF